MSSDKTKFGINYRNGATSCIACGASINERMSRSQGGRCDTCWKHDILDIEDPTELERRERGYG